MYPLPTLLTPLPLKPFAYEEITGCTNEAAKGANKASRNLPSCFFISCITVAVNPSIKTLESSADFMVLIISFISAFKINKVRPFLALTSTFPLIFLSSLFIAYEVKLLTNLSKLSLAKGIAMLVSAFFPKLLTNNQKIHLIELL